VRAPAAVIGSRRFMTERLHAPATTRNRDPILTVLERVLPPEGLVLEIASGTGEHAVYFAHKLPHLRWQPSDPNASELASIEAHRARHPSPNLLPAVRLDVLERWPVDRADAIVCINMIHIAPWRACEALFDGGSRALASGGTLYTYGPYRRGGRHTAESNATFDAGLRGRNPEWGVRDIDDVRACASECGFDLDEIVEMPANNLSLVFHRR
jgi:hypothetical protein